MNFLLGKMGNTFFQNIYYNYLNINFFKDLFSETNFKKNSNFNVRNKIKRDYI